MFASSSRKVSDRDAEQALTKLGLGSKSSAMSWDTRKGSAGSYSYTNMTATGDDGQAVTVEKLELSGVRMEEGAATFDILKASELQTKDKDASVSVGKIMLSGPSPDMAKAITKAISEGSKIDDMSDLDLNIDLDDEDIYFDAINIEDVTISADEGGGTLKQLAWGDVGDTGRGLFLLEELNLNVQEKNKPAVKIQLESASARGIDMAAFKNMSNNQKRLARGARGPMDIFGRSNAFAKTFDTAGFKNLDINVGTLSLRSDGGQGSANRKGDVTTIQQVLQPFIIKFTSPPEAREMKEVYDVFQILGYDEMVFTSSQTSSLNEKTGDISVENSYFDLQDGFRFSYNLEAKGLTDGNASPKEAMDDMEIARLDLALEDKSILDRAFKVAAKKQGSSPALLRMQAKGGLMLMTAMAQNEQQQEMASQLSKAVNRFIDDGGTIKVGINPDTPIRASDLQNINPGNMDMGGLGFYARTD